LKRYLKTLRVFKTTSHARTEAILLKPQEVLRFEATNQYGLLAEDDDDDGT